MKISSASKKVLCTALSAATALAFMPAVAFGACNGESITIKYNMDGGTLTNAGDQAIVGSETATTLKAKVLQGKQRDNKIALNSTYGITSDPLAAAAKYTKNGYKFVGFLVDENGNGVRDDNELVVDDSEDTFDVSGLDAGATLNLVAQYDTFEFGENRDDCLASNSDRSSLLAVDLDTPGNSTDGMFTLSVEKDGNTLASQTYTNSNAVPNKVWLRFGQESDASFTGSGTGIATTTQALSAGTYTFKLNDGTKTYSTDVQVISVTASAGEGWFKVGDSKSKTTTFLAVVNQAWGYVDALTDILAVYSSQDAKEADYTNGTYKLNGFYAGSDKVAVCSWSSDEAAIYGRYNTVEADQTSITAKYNAPMIDEAFLRSGSLRAYCENLDSSYASYKVAFAGNGVNETAVVEADDDGSYDASYDLDDKLAAGVYTVTLTGVDSTGQETTLDTATVTVTKIVLQAGEGQVKDANEAEFYTSESNLIQGDLSSSAKRAFTAPSGKEFDGWTIDGQVVVFDINASYAFTPNANHTVMLTATYKDIEQTKASVPTYTYKNGVITLSQDNGDDYEVRYSAGTVYEFDNTTVYDPASGGITVDITNYNSIVTAETYAKDSAVGKLLQKSDSIMVFGYNYDLRGAGSADSDATPYKMFSGYISDGLDSIQPSDSTKASPKHWDEVLKNAVSAGNAAIKAQGYASFEEWSELCLAQARNVIEAAAEYETKLVEAKATPQMSADGQSCTYSTKAQIEAAKAKIQQVIADFDGIHSGDDDYTPATDSLKGTNTVADYVQAITAASEACETTTVSAGSGDSGSTADKAAAADVDALIAALPAADSITQANYEKALTDAAAAQTAYDALTAAQKKLVTADVTSIAKVQVAAYKVQLAQAQEKAEKSDAANKKDIEELKAQIAALQDKLALSSMKATITKTVKVNKAKKKATKVKLKLPASESGNSPEVSTTKASKGVTVGLSGKKVIVKLKKKAKKGTYTAKVKVSYGAAAAKTVTVKFKVK